MLLRYGERSGKQPRFLASKVQVRDTDSPQAPAGCGGISVLAPYTSDPGSHAGRQLAHGRRANCGQKRVMVGKVPVGGVGHHAHHPRRFTEHHRVRATGPGQLEPRRR